MKHLLALLFVVTTLVIAGSASSAEWVVISRYLQPDGKLQFVFAKGGAGIGYSEAEQRQRKARGEPPPRDGVFAANLADCSIKRNIRCITLDDLLVFAVDVDAFMQQKTYVVRGTKFVPSCTSVSRPPKCGMGTVQFSNARTRGFFVISLKDGILMIGLDQYPGSELEEVYLLETGTPGLLHQ